MVRHQTRGLSEDADTDTLRADRLLDALMRGADLACQVSTREGFEIKVRSCCGSCPLLIILTAVCQVTEAIHKTRWIIATRAGGIPLQIRDGIDGALVPPGDPKAIAGAMYDFYASGKDKDKTGESRGNDGARPLGGRWTDEGSGPREELFTIGNATMWHVSLLVYLHLLREKEGTYGCPAVSVECSSWAHAGAGR